MEDFKNTIISSLDSTTNQLSNTSARLKTLEDSVGGLSSRYTLITDSESQRAEIETTLRTTIPISSKSAIGTLRKNLDNVKQSASEQHDEKNLPKTTKTPKR